MMAHAKGQNKQLKELPMVKAGKFEQQSKDSRMAYNPKQKINQ